MQTKANLLSKLNAARRSWTVRFSAALPVLAAVVVSLQDQLPAIAQLLDGWKMVCFVVVISAINSVLRVRSVKAEPAEGDGNA